MLRGAVILVLSLASVAHAQAPRWSLDRVPVDHTEVGVTVTLRLTAAGAVVRTEEGGEEPVSGAAACEELFAGELRGYRRRFGMRRSSDEGEPEHGGSGALEVRVIASASLEVARLAELITTSGYSHWPSRIALVVSLPSGAEATLPIAIVDRPDRADLVVGGHTTFQALVDRIARSSPTRRVTLHVR